MFYGTDASSDGPDEAAVREIMEEITPEMRRRAKVFNFALIYGGGKK